MPPRKKTKKSAAVQAPAKTSARGQATKTLKKAPAKSSSKQRRSRKTPAFSESDSDTDTPAIPDKPLSREQWLRKEKKWAPFRFLDMAPEMRNRVYVDYFRSHEHRTEALRSKRLAWALLPDLCKVNRQLRQESIELYFAIPDFKIAVGSDLSWQIGKREVRKLNSNYHRYEGTRDAGRILLPEHTELLLRAAGPKMVFRNIVFEVCDVGGPEFLRIWSSEENGPSERSLSTIERAMNMVELGRLHLCWADGVLTVDAEPRDESDAPWYEGWAPDIVSIMTVATTTARTLSTTAGFKGFTLLDLETIAAAFCAG